MSVNDISGAPDVTTPTPPDSLHGKPRRRMHLWLILVVVSISLPMAVLIGTKQQQNMDQEKDALHKKEAESKVSPPDSSMPIQTELTRQRRQADEDLGKQKDAVAAAQAAQDGKPGAPLPPSLAGQGSGRPAIAGMSAAGAPVPPPLAGGINGAAGQPQGAISEEARQENMRLSSAILAVDPNSMSSMAASVTGSNRPQATAAAPTDTSMLFGQGVTPAATQAAPRPDPANTSADIASRIIDASRPTVPDTANKANERWLDQQAAQAIPASTSAVKAQAAETLYQGYVIPAVTIAGTNSDLPGVISAQVTQDVYGTVSPYPLLIPKGARIVGNYNSDIKMGQERVLVAFTRLIYPSGASVALGGMSGADATGVSGLDADVNNHFIKQFGSSFMVALLSWFVDKNSNATTVNNYGSTTTPATATGSILLDIEKNIAQRNSNIQPTLTVPPGYKFLIVVSKDMILPASTTLVSR